MNEGKKKKYAWVLLLVAIFAMLYFVFLQTKTEEKAKDSEISKTIVEKKEESKNNKKIKVTSEDLAFRSSPEIKSGNQIGVFKKETVLNVIEKQGNWYKINTDDEKVGFVSAKTGYTEEIKWKSLERQMSTIVQD